MEIKVLGSGCASCKKLLANTEKAVKELGIEAEVIYVTDMEKIIETGIMSTPGLMINGIVKSTGRVLSPKEVMQMVSDSL